MATYDPKNKFEALYRNGIISKRSYNCLNNAGLVTIEHVIKYLRSGKELKDIPKIGRGCELEIKKLLQQCTLEETHPMVKEFVKDYYRLDPPVREFLTKAFKSVINSPTTNTETHNVNSTNTEVETNTNNPETTAAAVNASNSESSETNFITVNAAKSSSLTNTETLSIIETESTNAYSSNFVLNSDSEPNSNLENNSVSNNLNNDSNPENDSNSNPVSTPTHSHNIYPQGVRTYFALKYENANSFFEAIVQGKDEVFKIQPYLNTSENIAFRQLHLDVISEVIRLMEGKGMLRHSQYFQMETMLKNLSYDYREFSFTEILNNYINEDTDAFLQESFEYLSRDMLSRRALNFLQTAMPTYRDAVGYFRKSLEEYTRLCPGRNMLKTLSEIYDFVQAFHAQEFGSYERFLDDGEHVLSKVRAQYPYLNLQQCVFVRDFIQRYKVRPLFYLLYHYLRNSKRKKCVYFCLYHGLNDERQHYTLQEIAQMRRTSEANALKAINYRYGIMFDFRRTRQDLTFYENLFSNSPTPHLITEESELYKAIVKEEQLLEDDFELFGVLCQLLLPEKGYELFNDLGFNALTTKHFKEHVIQGSLFERFQKFNSVKYTSEKFFTYWHLSHAITSDYYNDVAFLLSQMTKDLPSLNKIAFTDRGVILGEKRLDIKAELVKILEEAGEPMSLQQIFDRFKELHPNHKFYKLDQLRPYLLKDKELIKPIGTTGRYGLSHWEHVYYGSISDLLYETLLSSDQPMHKDDILSAVLVHFPTTYLKSIIQMMRHDPQNRFIELEDGYYTLNQKRLILLSKAKE